MKNILLATLLFVSAAAGAATLPKALDGYFLTDRFATGATIGIKQDESFEAASKPIAESLEKFRKEKTEEFIELSKTFKQDEPLPFDARIGFTRPQYDKYIAAWGKRSIVDMEPVRIRIGSQKEDQWKLQAFGVTQQGALPLPLTNLSYDAKKDSWTSTNGELVRKDDVKFSKNHIWGEWTGSQWVYEEKGVLTNAAEIITIGKTAKGGDVYIFYVFREISPGGQALANNAFFIRIPAKEMKVDPLKASAEKNAQSKRSGRSRR